MSAMLALLCACCTAVPGDGRPTGYLCQPAFSLNDEFRGPLRVYQPQAGDIFFSTDSWWIIRFGHKLAGADAPHHSGLVIQKPDGQYCVLEAGPHNTLRIRVLDQWDSMSSYEKRGNMVFIRRRVVPLTPDQSARLAQFAMQQDGKRFALWRMMGQLTPLRSRQLIGWKNSLGGPHGARDSFWCAELVLETCTFAGLLDPTRIHPCCTYPKEIFFGRSTNKIVNDTLDINFGWEPPARWLGQVPLPATIVPQAPTPLPQAPTPVPARLPTLPVSNNR